MQTKRIMGKGDSIYRVPWGASRVSAPLGDAPDGEGGDEDG